MCLSNERKVRRGVAGSRLWRWDLCVRRERCGLDGRETMYCPIASHCHQPAQEELLVLFIISLILHILSTLVHSHGSSQAKELGG